MNENKKQVKTRMLLVDDHEMIRRGLRGFIDIESDLDVCAEAGSAQDALAQCSKSNPDIALIDLSLGEDSGLDLIKDMAVQFPNIKMLVVSMQNEQLYAERVLRAGASGFVAKDSSQPELVNAIRCVLTGKIYASPLIAQRIMTSVRQSLSSNPLEALSDRELAVFERIGKGAGTAEIAEAMSLSIKTIETYRSRIKVKLNIQSSSELMQRAVQWSIVEQS